MKWLVSENFAARHAPLTPPPGYQHYMRGAYISAFVRSEWCWKRDEIESSSADAGKGRYPLQTRGTCVQDELRYSAQTSPAKQPPPPPTLCVTELYMGPWPVACLQIDHKLDRPSAQSVDRFSLQKASENGEVCMLKNDAAVELDNKPPTRTRRSMSVIAGYWTFARDLLSQGKAEISKPTGRYDA